MIDTQSARAPILIVTRPASDASGFAEAVASGLGRSPETILSPLLTIVPEPATLPHETVAGVVFTSAHAVAHVPGGLPPGLPAWCVGDRTASVAAEAGFAAVSAAGDADALVALILDVRPKGPLLHLRGAHARGDVAKRLTRAGLRCDERVVYRQRPIAPTRTAKAAFLGSRPLVLPLFSPRTCAMLRKGADFLAPLHVIAISDAVEEEARALHPATLVRAARPDAAAMVAATVAALAALYP